MWIERVVSTVGDAVDEILVEVAGPGVKPETVAARELLELASAYLDALVRVARDETDEELSVTGLYIVQKCAAVKVFTDKPSLAFESGEAIRSYLTGRQEPGKGVGSSIARLKRAVAGLPPTYTSAARFHEAGREHVLQLVVDRPAVVLPPRERIELRATPIRAGGVKPLARFDARLEPKPFTLVASRGRDMIREVGAALWKPCDIVAAVARDVEGGIESGQLLEFSVAEPRSAEVWERWYRENREHLSLDPDREGMDE